jgi:NADH:ubiquinone oxidoreductase subunit
MFAIKINDKYYWCTIPRPFSEHIRRAVIYKTIKQAEAVADELKGRLHYICKLPSKNSLPEDMQNQTEFSISIVEVEMREVGVVGKL